MDSRVTRRGVGGDIEGDRRVPLVSDRAAGGRVAPLLDDDLAGVVVGPGLGFDGGRLVALEPGTGLDVRRGYRKSVV